MLAAFAVATGCSVVAVAQSPKQSEGASPTRLPVVAATWKSNYKKKQGKSLDLVAHREVSFKQTPVLPAAKPSVSPIVESKPKRWLRSTTSTAAATVAQQTIVRATREMRVGAWLSAEASAWEAMHWAAEAVDLTARENGRSWHRGTSALEHLQVAEVAIREARDFSGNYGSLNVEGIRRIALSHQTTVLANQSLDGITAMDAADRYLDEARTQLAPIAENSAEAVEAMDLLAEIYLGRADQKTFPSGTALCLRRAALQGQPRNRPLRLDWGLTWQLSDCLTKLVGLWNIRYRWNPIPRRLVCLQA